MGRKAMSSVEQSVDWALEESFPASDPPFFVGAGAYPGPAPRPKKERHRWGLDETPGDSGERKLTTT